jgi:hypothetical protein
MRPIARYAIAILISAIIPVAALSLTSFSPH